MSDQQEKLVVMIDASALKESSCILRLFQNVVIGYRGGINSNVIEFGTAFHLFRSHLRSYGKSSFGEAVRKAVSYYQEVPMSIDKDKAYLTEAFLSKTCLEYLMKYENKDNLEVLRFPRERFPLITEEDTKESSIPLIEPWTKFIIPYYSDDIVDILLAGTMDEVGLLSKGCVVVTDCKTSGVWKVKQYLDSYKLDPQLIFYVVILQMYAEHYPDSVFAELLNKYPIGAMIDGVFYKGADQPVIYERSDLFRFPDWLLNQYRSLLQSTVLRLSSYIHSWVKDKSLPQMEGIINGSCTTKYGPCKYSVTCSMIDTESRQIMLEKLFRIEQYNPLEFGGKHEVTKLQ